MRPSIESPNQQDLQKLRRADQLTSYYNQITQFRKSTELMHLLSSTEEATIIYVDEDKHFAIVQAKYLSELKQKLKDNEDALLKFSSRLREEHITKDLFNKIVQAKDTQIQKLHQQINFLEGKIAKFEMIIRNNEQVLDEKQIELNLLVEKYESQVAMIKSQKTDMFMNRFMKNQQKCDQEAQTSYWRSNDQQQESSEMRDNEERLSQKRTEKKSVEQSLTEKYQQQIKELKQNFAKALNEMMTKIQLKLRQVEQEKLDIREWSEANQKLAKQNLELKEQIKTVNQEEFKLRTWKSSLQNCIQNIEREHHMKEEQFSLINNSLPHSSALMKEASGFTAEQKVRLLQITIDKMQLEQREGRKKLEEIKQLIEEGADATNVSQENIIGTMLGLSSKIKEVVKYLLQDL